MEIGVGWMVERVQLSGRCVCGMLSWEVGNGIMWTEVERYRGSVRGGARQRCIFGIGSGDHGICCCSIGSCSPIM